MRDSFDCKLRVLTQDASKESQKEENAMDITRDHTPLARVLTYDPKRARVNCIIDITRARSTCMLVHVRTVVNCRG